MNFTLQICKETIVNPPFFSIIIPTCQRHETLHYAIKTVLQQNFKDFELIISDNYSSNDTKDVVNRFKDKRIKYVRTSHRVTMTENWEFAIANASGKYVIVFGDDDGLINNSLSYLYSIISQSKFQVIRWDRVYYSWPNVLLKQHANELNIPLINKKIQIIDGLELINKSKLPSFDYTELPMLYNSAIHIDIIRKLRNQTGSVFATYNPDLYSGFAFAYVAKKFISLGSPLSINGGSAHSNGTLLMFFPFFTKENINKIRNPPFKYHEWAPIVRSFDSFFLDCMLRLQDNYKINFNIKYIDVYKKIIINLTVFNEEEKDNAYEQIIKSCKNIDRCSDEIIKFLNKNPIKITATNLKNFKIGLNGRFLTINAKNFDIDNVFSVSKFINNFIEYRIS